MWDIENLESGVGIIFYIIVIIATIYLTVMLTGVLLGVMREMDKHHKCDYKIEGIVLIATISFIYVMRFENLLVIKGLMQMLVQIVWMLLVFKYISYFYKISDEVIYGSLMLSLFVNICEAWLLILIKDSIKQRAFTQQLLMLPLMGFRVSWIFPAVLGGFYGYANRREMENRSLK